MRQSLSHLHITIGASTHTALIANTRTKRTAMYCANTFSLHAGKRLENVLLQPINNLLLSVT